MRIRQYTAPTIQEALIQIKLDLGPDAVILHQRKLRKGGFLGLFGRDMVEVLAALDTQFRETSGRTRKTAPATEVAPAAPLADPWPAARIGPWDAPLPEDVKSGSSLPTVRSAGGQLTAQQVEQIKTAVLGELSSQVRDVVSRVVGTAVGEMADKVLGTMTDKVEAAVSRLEAAAPSKGSWTGPQQRIYDRLIKADVEVTLARQILVKLHGKGAESPEQLETQLPDILAGMIRTGGPILPATPGAQPQVAILVGPTGVGKTTTIAKLAANFRLAGVHVGLVTIDTYRIAAVEQLKVYGDIIGVPVEVVMTPGALREAISKMRDCQLILVDTAGRSPSNRLHLNELRSFVETVPTRQVHLVLSATSTRANLARAIDRFGQVGTDRLLITKIDEAATLGAVVSAAHQASRSLSYITHGQSVPDDLREASATELAAALLKP